MKVWIEPRTNPGGDGWPTTEYDVLTAEGDSVRPPDVAPFTTAMAAREWARGEHQIMDMARPNRR